jgi:hypothetical protein
VRKRHRTERQSGRNGSRHAEPIQLRIAGGSFEAFLAERGYSILEHLATSGMEKKYLTLRSGEPAGKALACFALVKAVAGRR